jgi:hypothetical protein
MLILALAFTLASSEPLPPAALAAEHNRAISCVAFFGVAAALQRNGVQGYNLVDVQKDGPRWAGLVGARIVAETALPREVIGFAIQEAVPAAQRLFATANPHPAIEVRQAECLPLMRADLAADDLSAPLPKPVKR